MGLVGLVSHIFLRNPFRHMHLALAKFLHQFLATRIGQFVATPTIVTLPMVVIPHFFAGWFGKCQVPTCLPSPSGSRLVPAFFVKMFGHRPRNCLIIFYIPVVNVWSNSAV